MKSETTQPKPIWHYVLKAARAKYVTEPCPRCGAWTKTPQCPPLGDCKQHVE